jgi:hypothetical protein
MGLTHCSNCPGYNTSARTVYKPPLLVVVVRLLPIGQRSKHHSSVVSISCWSDRAEDTYLVCSVTSPSPYRLTFFTSKFRCPTPVVCYRHSGLKLYKYVMQTQCFTIYKNYLNKCVCFSSVNILLNVVYESYMKCHYSPHLTSLGAPYISTTHCRRNSEVGIGSSWITSIPNFIKFGLLGQNWKWKCIHSHRAWWSHKSTFSPYRKCLFYLWFLMTSLSQTALPRMIRFIIQSDSKLLSGFP